MFSKTCEYALRAILYVATHTDEHKKSGIKEIAEALNLPVHFLGKILQNLVRKRILSSVKGPNGGFYLSRNTREIALLEVIEVIDGLHVFHKCGLGLEKCSDLHPCPIHKEYGEYRDNFKRLLSKKTVYDLSVDLKVGLAFIENNK